tara:strand:- start:17925 stop:19070 length:1146 start_codon:yes stop_codon:yes gene_type:complete
MFYTVFSTNDSPFMQWQSDLLEYSWKRAGQEGALIRLVATDDPQNLPTQKYAQCVATRLWDTHPETADAYPVYNKPASLLEWVFRDKPEGTVLLLDPDCVFRRAIERRVAPGFPASQAWAHFSTDNPAANNPFGLGERFAFLQDHCARVDLRIDPVMIPTLIHTRDLRKIGARWLELTGIVRENYRDGEGNRAWESDMFAYLAANAEYGLQHEPISLGICTNWEAEDAPDAPIIHYCNAVLDKDGKALFNKHQYTPWTRVDTATESQHASGCELIALLNAHIDNLLGVASPAALHNHPVWRDGVMEGRVHDDLLLEYPREDKSLWLNHSGKAIWALCDGSRTIGQIGSELSAQFSVDRDSLTAQVQTTAGQLHVAGFLDMR